MLPYAPCLYGRVEQVLAWNFLILQSITFAVGLATSPCLDDRPGGLQGVKHMSQKPQSLLHFVRSASSA